MISIVEHGWKEVRFALRKQNENHKFIIKSIIVAAVLMMRVSCLGCNYVCADSIPPNGWTDIYKTDKLVLRRIEPGTFLVTGNRTVTISKPFYIGIFEVTQKQYDHIMGGNLSHYRGATRPVECVSYDVLRGPINGAGWPQTRDVDDNSVIGVTRRRLDCPGFDLPTEAQWEYAARAGATAALYNGKSRNDTNLIGLARFKGSLNDGVGGWNEHTIVGSYAPNNWGIYDTLGNVWEWCLDWYESQNNWNGSTVTDPVGADSNESEYRCVRGGGWQNGSYNCSLTYRGTRIPYSSPCGEFGFRLACNAEDLGLATASNSVYCIIDLRGQDDHITQFHEDDYSFGVGCSSVFSYGDGMARLVGVKGLSQKDFKERATDGTIVFSDERITDVEKRTTTSLDDYWCEQFTDINMMVWTGWARYAGFTNEDDFAEYFIAHPDINADRGIIEWTISQSPYRYNGQSDRPTMKWAWANTIDGCNQFFPRMTNWMSSANCLTYIQLDWITPGTTNVTGSHAVTCCGYVVTLDEASSVQCVTHLFIINSDNDKRGQTGGRNAPNTITCVPVDWDSQYNRLFLRFSQTSIGMIRFGCYQYTHEEMYRCKSFEGMNDVGEETIEVFELSEAEMTPNMTLVVKGDNLDPAALAAKITPKPCEKEQSVSFFKVKAEFVSGGVSLSVVLDENAIRLNETVGEIVGAANMAAFSAAADDESVLVRLSSAKSGLYYGIVTANDLAELNVASADVPLMRADANGVVIPVTKTTSTSAFFKVIVCDRVR